MTVVRKSAVAGVGVSAALGMHLRWVRPRMFTWGATSTEICGSMVGDDVCPRPHLNATRAVTIAARPEDVWSWLVQWGWNRGPAPDQALLLGAA